MDYWIMVGEQRKGPYTLQQLSSMWSSGHLTSDTRYYDPAGSCWERLRKLIEPQPVSAQPPSTPAPFLHSNDSYADDFPDESDTPSPPHTFVERFTFTGRWSRLRFLGAVMFYSLAILAWWWLCGPFGGGEMDDTGKTMFGLGAMVFLYLILCAAVKRMHDFGWPAWGALFLVIQITWLILLIARGDKKDNRYGEAPR